MKELTNFEVAKLARLLALRDRYKAAGQAMPAELDVANLAKRFGVTKTEIYKLMRARK